MDCWKNSLLKGGPFETLYLMQSTTPLRLLLAFCFAGGSALLAGEPVTVSGKEITTTTADVPYEANRGLVTLRGPSGMFINPTSATLPANTFTIQYCFLAPDFDFNGSLAHGTLLSYGVTDWLEVGALTIFLTDSPLTGGTDFAAGPMGRVRLLKHDGWIPQVSIGGYGKFGDETVRESAAFLALTERFEIGNGVFKSVAFNAGALERWTKPQDDFRGYVGVELQLPYRLYLIGEVNTNKVDGETSLPWAAGVQWRAGGINVSLSALGAGAGKTGLWFGIGTAF